MDDEHYMRLAMAEAREAAEEGEIPVGAVIVADDRIIARAHNETQRQDDVTAHAEMLALTQAANTLGSKYLSRCTLYVTLEPCTMCAGALRWSQIGAIVYGASDPKNGYSHFAPAVIHPRTELRTGVLADECAALMTDFFKKRR